MNIYKYILWFSVLFWFALTQSCQSYNHLIVDSESQNIEISYKNRLENTTVIFKNISQKPIYISPESFIVTKIIEPYQGINYSNILDGSADVIPIHLVKLDSGESFQKKFSYSLIESSKIFDCIYFRVGYFTNIDSCKIGDGEKKKGKIEVTSYCYYSSASFFNEFRFKINR